MEPSRFATLLRQHRVNAGLSQEALAEAAGISTSAIGTYERGIHSAPHRDTVLLLADALRLVDAPRAEFELAARRKPRSLQEGAGNGFPLASTSFIGREREIEQTRDLLRQQRVVTLTGSGGIGKTRLALRVAVDIASAYKNGAWFIDFGKITDESQVVAKLASTLRVGAPRQGETPDSFAARLQRRELLLIFDNCEHVIQTVGILAASIVRTCPRITILATSRERLRISGEVVIRVPTLPVPRRAAITLAEAHDNPAVALFVDRAIPVALSFELTESHLANVLEICRRLDGIPLAIELAAARLSSLGLVEIRNGLKERFTLLSIGPRDLAPRQQTLLATINWSYNLLGDRERSLLESLSLFAGSFTLRAVQTLVEGATVSKDVVELLSSLVEKSLLSIDSIDETDRYFMLESVREYARNKIDPPRADALMGCYANWAATVADDCERTRFTISSEAWVRRVARDFDNVSVALTWALGAGRDALIAARIVTGLRGFWTAVGRVGELPRIATALLDLIDGGTHPCIAGRLHLARLDGLDFHETLASLDAARTFFEQVGDPKDLAICHLYFAHTFGSNNDHAAALAASDTAAEFAREADAQRLFPIIALVRAEARFEQRNFAEARSLAKEAMEDFTLFDETALATLAARFLFKMEIASDNHEAAAMLANQIEARIDALEADLQSNIRVSLLLALACYRTTLGELEPALSSARFVLLDHQAQWQPYVVLAIECVAAVAALHGDLRLAARLHGFVNANDSVSYVFDVSTITCRPILASELRRLTASELRAHLADGAELGMDEAIREALSHSGISAF